MFSTEVSRKPSWACFLRKYIGHIGDAFCCSASEIKESYCRLYQGTVLSTELVYSVPYHSQSQTSNETFPSIFLCPSDRFRHEATNSIHEAFRELGNTFSNAWLWMGVLENQSLPENGLSAPVCLFRSRLSWNWVSMDNIATPLPRLPVIFDALPRREKREFLTKLKDPWKWVIYTSLCLNLPFLLLWWILSGWLQILLLVRKRSP